MMVFFLNSEQKIYARYGGRDSEDAENRMSLPGLRATMQSVLTEHASEKKRFAPRTVAKEFTIREVVAGGGRCLHCHQVKEALNTKLVRDQLWSRDSVYRFPLPENLGFRLHVDRSNVVEKVTLDTAAAKIGLQAGDTLRRIGAVPIHSFGDATYALDKAPTQGEIELTWLREGRELSAKASVVEGWKKTDISWRPSMQRLIPTVPLYGEDLKSDERKKFALTEKQIAFRQNDRLQTRAKEAGFQVGDIILGIDGLTWDGTVDHFIRRVKKEYLVGDTLNIKLLREGKPMSVSLLLTNR